jgi:hypothetical protein
MLQVRCHVMCVKTGTYVDCPIEMRGVTRTANSTAIDAKMEIYPSVSLPLIESLGVISDVTTALYARACFCIDAHQPGRQSLPTSGMQPGWQIQNRGPARCGDLLRKVGYDIEVSR